MKIQVGFLALIVPKKVIHVLIETTISSRSEHFVCNTGFASGLFVLREKTDGWWLISQTNGSMD
jgi:hypothetical protein